MVEFEHSYNLSFVNMQVRHHNNVLAELDKYYEKLGTETFKYYMFGSFDILYLSKLNNFGNAQELFLNKEEVATNKPYTNLLLTGILKHEEKIESSNFEDSIYKKYALIAITNFKLNNKFLISTDAKMFFDSVENKIKELLKDKEECSYFILQTFSWHEISVVIFSNDHEIISEFIQESREKTLEDIEDCRNIHSNSLCNNDEFDSIKNSDIFSDSYSYFGVNLEKFEKEKDEKHWKTHKIKSEIEWQIKPGHFATFINLLEEKFKKENIEFKKDNIKMVIGKSDYNYQGCFESLADNYKIHKILKEELNDDSKKEFEKIIYQVRNFRTNLLFDKIEGQNKIKDTEGDLSYRVLLLSNFKTKLGINKIEDLYKNLDDFLYKIKVSKHMHEMIIKMYFLYINGLQDPVLSMLFNDFTNFMVLLYKNLEEKTNELDEYFDIDNESEVFKNGKVDDIESYLYQFIDIFDSSFRLRILNNYKFEDISELNIDFNTPIPQILSMYNTFANYIGKIILGSETNFVVRLNYKSTVSNNLSINYNIYDLVHSEFVYFTLPKEILNNIDIKKYNMESFRENYKDIYDPFSDIFKKFDSVFKSFSSKTDFKYNLRYFEFIRKEIWDYQYFFSDLLTFHVFLDNEIELYKYWTWTTTFKNSSIYNLNGSINEDMFLFHLYRYYFMIEYFKKTNKNNDEIKIKCLNPLFEDVWSKHIDKVQEDMKCLIKELDINEMSLQFNLFRKKILKDNYMREFIVHTMKYLSKLKNHNFENDIIEMFYRNWENGKSIGINDSSETSLYMIDNKGTISINQKYASEYFKLKNNNRLDMYFLSLRMKHELLN